MLITKPRRILTPQEVSALISAAQAKPRDQLILKCLYFLALKSSQLAEMSVNNTHLSQGHVTISNRSIPVPEGFSKDFSAFLESKSGLLFPGRQAGMLSDRHIRRLVKDYAGRAGLQNPQQIKPHTLRSSYAAHLSQNNVPDDIIQQILGHKKKQTTTLYTSRSLNSMHEWLSGMKL